MGWRGFGRQNAGGRTGNSAGVETNRKGGRLGPPPRVMGSPGRGLEVRARGWDRIASALSPRPTRRRAAHRARAPTQSRSSRSSGLSLARARRPERACGERELRRPLVARYAGVSGAGGLEVVALVRRGRFAREAKGEPRRAMLFSRFACALTFATGWSSDREHTRSCCEPSRRPEHASDAW
jgi:hypothetical protein